MSRAAGPGRTVLVVIDPDFGECLRDAWHGQSVWIAMSPANAPVVRALWPGTVGASHPAPLTGFLFDESAVAEECFLAQLHDIDLHHGPYSSTMPYTVLEVIGARLTSTIQRALSELGFSTFQQGPDSFVAGRSGEEASRIRS